jgi:hypothetical protein
MGSPLLLRSEVLVTEKNIPAKADVTVDVGQFAAFVDGFKSAKKNEQDWKEAKERLQEFLQDKLKGSGANVGTINGVEVIRLSEFPKDSVNWKKLKAEHPTLVEQYTSQVDAHRFSAK